MPKSMPRPFRYRGGWRVQVTLANGTRPAKDFDSFDEAKAWANDTLANANAQHEPELGGPTRATLAEALQHYARLYTVTKGGVDAELNRINHYLVADRISPLRACKSADGKVTLEAYAPKSQPKAWQKHNDERRALRLATYEAIQKLAQTRCSQLCTADFRRLITTMTQDGLSESTIQKEIALLRHLFNVAAREWQWKGFENPTVGIKLGKSQIRFVVITRKQEEALWQAISECDNPFFWPLVVCGLETTMRLSSMLSMRWESVDLENRQALVDSKTGQVVVPLSQHIVNVLSDMPRDASGRVFPMTSNAVKMAWNGVREKAGLPKLQFRDLRHLGATDYARRGLSAHHLRTILGHKTLHMAQVYVNLAATDILDAMDETARPIPPVQVPRVAEGSAQEITKRRRSERLADALRQKLQKAAQEQASPSSATAHVEEASGTRTEQRAVHTTTMTIPAAGTASAVAADAASSCAATPGSGTNATQTAMRPDNVIRFPGRRAA